MTLLLTAVCSDGALMAADSFSWQTDFSERSVGTQKIIPMWGRYLVGLSGVEFIDDPLRFPTATDLTSMFHLQPTPKELQARSSWAYMLSMVEWQRPNDPPRSAGELAQLIAEVAKGVLSSQRPERNLIEPGRDASFSIAGATAAGPEMWLVIVTTGSPTARAQVGRRNTGPGDVLCDGAFLEFAGPAASAAGFDGSPARSCAVQRDRTVSWYRTVEAATQGQQGPPGGPMSAAEVTARGITWLTAAPKDEAKRGIMDPVALGNLPEALVAFYYNAAKANERR